MHWGAVCAANPERHSTLATGRRCERADDAALVSFSTHQVSELVPSSLMPSPMLSSAPGGGERPKAIEVWPNLYLCFAADTTATPVTTGQQSYVR
jgi:hypothetical protein